jgi:hypothetical protein
LNFIPSCYVGLILNLKDFGGKENEIEQIFNEVSKRNVLATLALPYCHIGTKGLKALLPRIKYCTKLSVLDLTGNEIDDEGATELATFISECSPPLSRLIVFFEEHTTNYLTEQGMSCISNSILQTSVRCSINYLAIESSSMPFYLLFFFHLLSISI